MENSEISNDGALEKLQKSFEGKLSRIEDGMKFIDVLQYSIEGKFTLKEIHEDIVDLSCLCEAIREKIKIEKERLETMKKQGDRLHSVRDRMNYINYHLPSTLPKRETTKAHTVLNTATNTKLTVSSVTSNKENDRPKKGIAFINLLQEEDLKRIPKHVKSHLTVDQINNGIREVNLILEKKYEFLKRPRKSLSLHEEKKRSQYLHMGKDLKGTSYEIFFMDADVQEYTRILKTKKKTKESVFLILRHLEKMKEMRKGKPPRYCILPG